MNDSNRRHTIPIAEGDQFGRLTVLSRASNRPYGGRRWLCQCECGNQTIVDAQALREDKTKSCGCGIGQAAKLTHTKHGYARDEVNYTNGNKRHPLYNTWLNMRQRCNNPNHRQYADYGGRGITVDPSWDDFAQFVQDMGERPTRYHSLEKIDNEKSYRPDNCCWATRDEQNGNRRGLGITGMKQLPDYLEDCVDFLDKYQDQLTGDQLARLQAICGLQGHRANPVRLVQELSKDMPCP